MKRSKKLIEECDSEELKDCASEIGENLLTICYFDIDEHLGGRQKDIKRIGIELDVIETVRISSNARHSMNEILLKITECRDQLAVIANELNLGL